MKQDKYVPVYKFKYEVVGDFYLSDGVYDTEVLYEGLYIHCRDAVERFEDEGMHVNVRVQMYQEYDDELQEWVDTPMIYKNKKLGWVKYEG
jgi:hypothetical protein